MSFAPDSGADYTTVSGYRGTDFSQIEADIHAMENFAKALLANVQDSYVPQSDAIVQEMMTSLPNPHAEFYELHSFLMVHRDAQDASLKNVYEYANGTHNLANAAENVSKKYAGTDAFAHARVSDVEKELNKYNIPGGELGVGGQGSASTSQATTTDFGGDV